MQTNPNPSVTPTVTPLDKLLKRPGVNTTLKLPEQLPTTEYTVPDNRFSQYMPQGQYQYVPGLTEEHRAQLQPATEQLLRSTGKFLGKTGINVTGGLAGTVYGSINAIAAGDFSKLYDNEVINTLDYMSKELDNSFPVYKTKEFQDSNFFQKLFTHPAQTSDEFSDALAFTAGAILTGLMTGGAYDAVLPGKAISAMSALTKAAKAGKVVAGMERAAILKNIVDAGRLGNQLFFGSNYESIIETKHSMMELERKLRESGASEDEINQAIQEAEKFSWATNMAVVGASNILQFPKVFGLSYGKNLLKMGDISMDAGKAVSAYSKASKFERALGTAATILEKPAIEGLWEEGMQGVIQRTSTDYWARKYDPEAIDTVNSFIDSFSKSLVNTYTTKEGWNEIGMGMLIGGIGGPGGGLIGQEDASGKKAPKWQGGIVGSFQERSAKRKQTDQLVAELNANPNVLPVIKAQYESLIRDASIQGGLDKALELNDKFAWKNLKHDQIYNWIRSRVKAGLTDVAKTQIEALKDLSAEEFSTQLMGEKSEVQVNEKQKEKIISHLLEKVDDVVKATDKIDQVYRSNTPNKEEDPIRETLIHSITSLKDLDQREADIYQSISDLTSGIANNYTLRQEDPTSFKNKINSLKEALKAPGLKEEDKKQIEAVIQNLEKALKESPELGTSNLDEIDLLQKWEELNPSEFTINKDEVIQMLADAKKIRERRHKLIDLYNQLFTKKGQDTIKKAEAKIKTTPPEKQPQETFEQKVTRHSESPEVIYDGKTKGRVVYNEALKRWEFKSTDGSNKTIELSESNIDKVTSSVQEEQTPEEIQAINQANALIKAFQNLTSTKYEELDNLQKQIEELEDQTIDTLAEVEKYKALASRLDWNKNKRQIAQLKSLIRRKTELLNKYSEQQELLIQKSQDLEQVINILEGQINKLQTQNFTNQQIKAEIDGLINTLSSFKYSSIDELTNLINITNDHIERTEIKIKQLKQHIDELNQTLAKHEEWIKLLDEVFNKFQIVPDDKSPITKYLSDKLNNNPTPFLQELKELVDREDSVYGINELYKEIQSIVKALKSEDFDTIERRSSIPMNQYLLEIYEGQLKRQKAEIAELNKDLEIQKNAQILFDLYAEAEVDFKKFVAQAKEAQKTKPKPKKPTKQKERNPSEQPTNKDISSPAQSVASSHYGVRGFQMENGNPAKNEDGSIVPKANRSEWEAALELSEANPNEAGKYSVVFITEDNSNYNGLDLSSHFTEIESQIGELVLYAIENQDADFTKHKNYNLTLEQWKKDYKNTPDSKVKEKLDKYLNDKIKYYNLLKSTFKGKTNTQLFKDSMIKSVKVLLLKDGQPVIRDGHPLIINYNSPTYAENVSFPNIDKKDTDNLNKARYKFARELADNRMKALGSKVFYTAQGIKITKGQINTRDIDTPIKTVFGERLLEVKFTQGKVTGQMTSGAEPRLANKPYIKDTTTGVEYLVKSAKLGDTGSAEALLDLLIWAGLNNQTEVETSLQAVIKKRNATGKKLDIFSPTGLVNSLIYYDTNTEKPGARLIEAANETKTLELQVGKERKVFILNKLEKGSTEYNEALEALKQTNINIEVDLLDKKQPFYQITGFTDNKAQVEVFDSYEQFLIEKGLKTNMVPLDSKNNPTHLSRQLQLGPIRDSSKSDKPGKTAEEAAPQPNTKEINSELEVLQFFLGLTNTKGLYNFAGEEKTNAVIVNLINEGHLTKEFTLKQLKVAATLRIEKLSKPLFEEDTKPQSDIEAKKADIEKRRNEELDKNLKMRETLAKDPDITDNEYQKIIARQQANAGKIDAKYDAELATLETKSTTKTTGKTLKFGRKGKLNKDNDEKNDKLGGNKAEPC